MSNSLETDLALLATVAGKQQISVQDTLIVADVINRYLSKHKRHMSFATHCELVLPRFKELLAHLDFTKGTEFTLQFFVFCYSLISGPSNEKSQHEIYLNLSLPFLEFVKHHGHDYKPFFREIPRGKDYVFLCRHATLTGMYAPGKSIYTYAEALLERGENVWILALYNLDKQFLGLKDRFPNLRISKLIQVNIQVRIVAIIDILKLIKPRAIITETEFDLPSIVSILAPHLPTIYISQGFNNLPWYDMIGTAVELKPTYRGRDRDKFFYYDLWLSQAALAPPHDVVQLNKIKFELGINDQNIVIGSFARMQKFSDEFLDLVINSLEKNNLIKFILAGSGDNSLVIKRLSKFIELKRVFVLPPVDTALYGHLLTLGLDTFPDHSGYSVIETMAKGVPVFSKDDNHFQALKKDRLEETIFQTNQDFVKILTHFRTHTTKHIFYKQRTKDFFERYRRNKDLFLETLENIIKEIETS